MPGGEAAPRTPLSREDGHGGIPRQDAVDDATRVRVDGDKRASAATRPIEPLAGAGVPVQDGGDRVDDALASHGCD